MHKVYKIEPNNTTDLVLAKSKYQSVVLLNTPKLGLNNPPMAPALLQSIAKSMGCSVDFIDINLEFQTYFANNNRLLNDWCELEQELSADELDLVEAFTQTLDLDTIFRAQVVGISVFSIHSFAYTTWFLERYRQQMSGIVVVGGAGANSSDYGKKLYEKGLIDFYTIGEGELSWRAILSDRLPFPGVNSVGQSLQNFDSIPIPDYSGFRLEQYINSRVHGITIGVEGSRGCVRNCTFCDIRSFWDKYKFKDGVKLANELIKLKEQYDVKHFFFNDSLVNGSDRAFRDFINVLAIYNRWSDNKIHWSGYYIIKPAITYKEKDWINLKDSGVRSLYIGIESGSEQVRDHMKKKFSNSDIDYAMTKIQLYGIRCTWLLIVGYPTETEQDFESTLDLLTRYQPMALDRTIDTVALGFTLGIIPGSPLESLKEQLNIQSAFPGHTDNGIYWKNENSNFKIRVQRRIRAERLIRQLGYNSWVGDNDVIAYFEQKLDQLERGIIIEDDIAEHHG